LIVPALDEQRAPSTALTRLPLLGKAALSAYMRRVAALREDQQRRVQSA